MPKRKKVWIDYQHRLGDIVEIILRDYTKAKIMSWVININDKKRARQILKALKKDYGVDFGIDFKKEKDLDWIP